MPPTRTVPGPVARVPSSSGRPTPGPALDLAPLPSRRHLCTKDCRGRAIDRIEAFAPLTAHERHRVIHAAGSRVHTRGDVLFDEGEDAGFVRVVVAGRVKLTQLSSNGKDVVVEVVPPGRILDIAGALGRSTHEYRCVALTQVCVLVVPAPVVAEVLASNSAFAARSLRETMDRLDVARRTVRGLSADTAEQRVAAAVLQLTHDVGVETIEGLVVDAPVSRTDVASMCGVAPETASRVLSRLHDRGVVETRGRTLVVLDRDALNGLAPA